MTMSCSARLITTLMQQETTNRADPPVRARLIGGIARSSKRGGGVSGALSEALAVARAAASI